MCSGSEACCRGFLFPVMLKSAFEARVVGSFRREKEFLTFGRLWVPCELLQHSSKSCSTSGCSQVLLELSHGSYSVVLLEETCLLQVGCAQ